MMFKKGDIIFIDREEINWNTSYLLRYEEEGTLGTLVFTYINIGQETMPSLDVARLRNFVYTTSYNEETVSKWIEIGFATLLGNMYTPTSRLPEDLFSL